MLCETIPEHQASGCSEFVSSFLVGDISVEVIGTHPNQLMGTGELERFKFIPGKPDIMVDVTWSAALSARKRTPDFDSGAAWALFRDGKDFIFDFTSTALGPIPYKRMRISDDFRRAQITLNRELVSGRPHPLEYPTDELLITNYLAHHGMGVEVHGCGLIDRETGGHLFLGHSGAGKSTMARLWRSLRNAEILSDDRIIVRFQHSALWMYGTPWHGEAQFASASKSKLNRIFILQHGVENKISPLSRARAVGELFARSFPPFHSAEGLERVIDFLNRAFAAVPCYEFQFTPDSRALDAVLDFHD